MAIHFFPRLKFVIVTITLYFLVHLYAHPHRKIVQNLLYYYLGPLLVPKIINLNISAKPMSANFVCTNFASKMEYIKLMKKYGDFNSP